MPNIIEQQDLLKGLPDDRLAAMMQAPTGDIPPFLVAAEAQRRQTIREQFSGGPQESVVDTLTKQMANVPQNIQAPAQQPPQMPPPDMGGVAALQGEQQMRDGGYVQRYQDAGLVVPSFRGRAGAGAYLPGEEPEGDFFTRGFNYVDELTSPFFERAQKFGINPTTQQVEELKEEVLAPKLDPYRYGMTAEERQMMQARPPVADVPTPPTDPGKEPTSDENKLKEYEAQLRAIGQIGSGDSAYIKGKLQELYGDNEASDWEKAQKWFAAAQAAIEPGQNNWQAAVNALSAFGGGMAEERAAERAGDRELAEALLKYEIADRQYLTETERDIAKDMMNYRISLAKAEKDAADAKREDELGAFKFAADVSTAGIRSANDEIDRLERKKADYIKGLPEQLPGAEPIDYNKDPYIAGINSQISRIQSQIDAAQGRVLNAISGYGKTTGTNLSIPVWRDGRLQQ